MTRLRAVAVVGVLIFGSAAAEPRPESDWEPITLLDAATLLGAETVAGPNYKVEPSVESDGLMNRYVVSSHYQRVGAYSDSLVRERVHEQRAIGALRLIKKTEAYKDGLTAAARAPLTITRRTLTDPVGVMKSVPGAVSNLWSDVSSAVGGLGKGTGDWQPSQTLKELLGYHRVKARLAARFGVDFYSSNAVLQQDLDDVSWSLFAGGAAIDVAMSQAPIAGSLAVRAAREIDTAHAPLWDIPQATLMAAASEQLQAMGLPAEEADTLARHPVCTLTHQPTLVSLLADLPGVSGRDAFARHAATAQDEASCRLHVEVAKLIWIYHRQQVPVQTIGLADGIATVTDAERRVVLPLRADYVFWTSGAYRLVEALPSEGERALWLSGVLSGRARAESELNLLNQGD